jgi:hypothetical protein
MTTQRLRTGDRAVPRHGRCLAHDLQPRPHPELAENVGYMGLNGSPGQEQLARDVRVGPATGDQTGDPGLGVGQGLPATRRAAVQRAGATPDAVGPHPRLHASMRLRSQVAPRSK